MNDAAVAFGTERRVSRKKVWFPFPACSNQSIVPNKPHLHTGTATYLRVSIISKQASKPNMCFCFFSRSNLPKMSSLFGFFALSFGRRYECWEVDWISKQYVTVTLIRLLYVDIHLCPLYSNTFQILKP
jgi:hypothetical protein